MSVVHFFLLPSPMLSINIPQFVYPFIHAFPALLGWPCSPYQNYFLWFAISDYTLCIYPVKWTPVILTALNPFPLIFVNSTFCPLNKRISSTPGGLLGLFWLEDGYIWLRLDQSESFLRIFWMDCLSLGLGIMRAWSQGCQWAWKEAWGNEVGPQTEAHRWETKWLCSEADFLDPADNKACLSLTVHILIKWTVRLPSFFFFFLFWREPLIPYSQHMWFRWGKLHLGFKGRAYVAHHSVALVTVTVHGSKLG